MATGMLAWLEGGIRGWGGLGRGGEVGKKV